MIRKLLQSVKSSLVYSELHRPLKSQVVLFVSRNGKDFAGNMLRLLIELNKKYGQKYQYVIALEKGQFVRIQRILNEYGLGLVQIMRYDSLAYLKLLHRAAYLFSDTSVHMRYVKRSGQTYINTWHGTPFKKMGIDSPSNFPGNGVCMDNVQRNLFAADYLLFPSQYFQDIMVKAYSLDGLYSGIILREGYPRNSIFFDEVSRQKTKERYGLNDKKVYVYMPTFREFSGDGYSAQLHQYLKILDRELMDEEVLFIKIHYHEKSKHSFQAYNHIHIYPQDIETYEFLNIADCLITDYSSVIYDFAVTGRKIVQWTFDTEKYTLERGLYQQAVPFPFPVVEAPAQLLQVLREAKNYSDDAFRKAYCMSEKPDAAARIIEHIFEGKKCCPEKKVYETSREKVFFFAGALSLNGITTSARNIMAMETSRRLYYVSFSRKMLEFHTVRLANLPMHHGIVEISGSYYCTLAELIALLLYYKCHIDIGVLRKRIGRFYDREATRTFSGMGFDAYVHFDGYGMYVTGLLQHAQGRRIIFVHNDMRSEIDTRNNQNILVLKDAYRSFDKVAVVSRELVYRTSHISGRRDNIMIVRNCQNVKGIRERGNQVIKIEKETIVYHIENQSIEAFLGSHEKNFITIGRFSAEKRHGMLIEAFEILNEDDVGLIIIGGHGDLLEQTIQKVKTSRKAKDMMVVFSMSNPMPVLKRCDLFILSSLYEGMPVVLYEAECLGVPSVVVDTVGCHEFMAIHGGTPVEDSVEGLVRGMGACLEGKAKTLGVNFDQFNTRCIQQFDALFKIGNEEL